MKLKNFKEYLIKDTETTITFLIKLENLFDYGFKEKYFKKKYNAKFVQKGLSNNWL